MKKVLHYIPGFRKGGIESLVLDIYNNIDYSNIRFDIVIEESMGDICEEDLYKINQLGGNIIKISPFTPKTILLHIKDIINIFKENEYDVVHSHSLGKRCIFMIISKIYKVPLRIIHGHTSIFENNVLINKIGTKISILCSNKCIACSNIVKENMFNIKNDKTDVIYNGIDLEKFNPKKRNNIKDNIKFVHIGRFTYAKNHTFLIETFKKISEKLDNSVLTLVGDGPNYNEIKKLIDLYDLNDKINILPPNSDIPKVLLQSDYAIFPSIYEGFGISAIEFQAMKLPCFISDTVPSEVNIGLCEFISLDKGSEYWGEYITRYVLNDENKRYIDTVKIDIKNISNKMEMIYKGIK